MKLQKQKTRILEGKEYSKWVLVIPSQQIEQLGWNEGQELEGSVAEEGLLIAKVTNHMQKPKKISYEEFRDSIENFLKNKKEGSTWEEIRITLNFTQKVPNNLWVRTMERDIGLLREKVGTKNIWRLKA